MTLDELLATAREVMDERESPGDRLWEAKKLARAVIAEHEGRAGKLRAELLALTKTWRSTPCGRGDGAGCDGGSHAAACPLNAMELDMMALVDALAIAEHEEAKSQ